MKKFGIFVMSIFTIMLGTVLCACTLKNVGASFAKDEEIILIGQSVDLDEQIKVEGISKKDISYSFSDPSVLKLVDRKAVALKSGSSTVFAMNGENCLTTMKIVVKDKYQTPTNIAFSEGVLSWDVVFDSNTNKAEKYIIEGTRTIYSQTEPDKVTGTEQISEESSENKFTFTLPGKYDVKLKAASSTYFEESDYAEISGIFAGFMPSVLAEEISFIPQTGRLEWNWAHSEGARFRIKLDDEYIIAEQQGTTFFDMSAYLETASAGQHSVSIVAYDVSNKKVASESEPFVIEKLSVAAEEVEYEFSESEGGKIVLNPSEKAANYEILLYQNTTVAKTIELTATEKTTLDFSGLAAGEYLLKVVAKNDENGYFKSDEFEFGKIYKMQTLQLSAGTNDQENAVKFNFNVVGVEESVSSSLAFYDGEEKVEATQEESGFSVDVASAGVYVLRAVQLPTAAENLIGEENVYVINSDASEPLSVTKVAEIAAVTHSLDEVSGNSKLSFEDVGAEEYQLFVLKASGFELVDETLFTAHYDTTPATIDFTGKIENLFEAVMYEEKLQFVFKIVAKNAAENVLASAKIKAIELLCAPTTLESGNSEVLTYAWNAVAGADAYQVKIAQLSKEQYLANKYAKTFTPDAWLVDETCAEPQFTLSHEGYFYIQVFALSTDLDTHISSKQRFEDIFFISKKLEVGEVVFGNKDEYVSDTSLTTSSGYYVQIADAENVSQYSVSIDSASDLLVKKMSGNTICLFAENFDVAGKTYTISIVANGTDDVIYKSSDAKEIVVKKLDGVAYADIALDDLQENLSVKPKTGAREISMTCDGTTITTATGSAKLSIANKTNFDVDFVVKGSLLTAGVFEYSNDEVFLDSNSTTLHFTRVQAPKNLAYNAGKIVFEHDAISVKDYYVLDMFCTTADGEKKLSVKFERSMSAVYEGLKIPLGQLASDYVVEKTGNVVEIDVAKLIELVKTSAPVADLYNQTSAIEFSVYAYALKNSASNVTLSSPYATTKLDGSTRLVVEKMPKPSLSFAAASNAYTLSWNEVETNAQVASQTVYTLLVDGQPLEGGEFTGSTTTNFSISSEYFNNNFETGTYYTFQLKARNPYYLESSDSNIVRVFKLNALRNLTLTENGELRFEILTAQQTFATAVKVSANGVSKEVTDGKISLKAFEKDGSSAGVYTFEVVGKEVSLDADKIYYLNSVASTWTVKEMTELAPTDNAVSFANNVLSWQPYASGSSFSTLCYVVKFVDSQKEKVTFVTAENVVNLKDNAKLYADISKLKEGEISIGVSAYLGTYSVSAGGTIYYSAQQTLLDETSAFNHYLYQNAPAAKKLTTPNITKVEFVSASEATAQKPDLKLTFEGNYGSVGRFAILLNNNDLMTTDITENAGKYELNLTFEQFNNVVSGGETLTVMIKALSTTDIPSSIGSVDIIRANNLQNVELKKAGETFTHTASVTIGENFSSCVGGVILKIDYTPNEGDVGTIYKTIAVGDNAQKVSMDISDVFETYLQSGGYIKISAFANNFADDASKTYYLTSPSMVNSTNYPVLKSVPSVTTSAGGFTIDSALNTANTTYNVSYGSENYQVTSADEFYFELPSTWENGTYNITLWASEENKVDSAKTTIEYALSRLDRVGDVTITRDADNLGSLTFSWASVTNSNGYLVRIFDSADNSLIHEFTSASNNTTFADIFGENYANVPYENVGKILDGVNVRVEITSIGSGSSNNSMPKTFNASIKRNPLSIEENNVTLDEYANIQFSATAGQTYIYRFVDNTGAVLQNWKMIQAESEKVTLDTKGIAQKMLFNLEIKLVDSAISSTASSSDNPLIFDSYAFTTLNNDLTYYKNESVISVALCQEKPEYLEFILDGESATKLFVGLSENALAEKQVVQILPFEIEGLTNKYYGFTQIVDELRAAGIAVNTNEELTLYVWSFRQTTEPNARNFVISNVYKDFVINFAAEDRYVGLRKKGEATADGFAEDYANTFIIFTNADTAEDVTLGVNVKITAQDNTDFAAVNKFVPKAQMLGHEYFSGENVFAINLTQIFDGEEFASLSGKFNVAVSRVSSVQSTLGSEIVQSTKVCDWTYEEVTLLKGVENVRLSFGTLYWSATDSLATKYYVYFFEEKDGNMVSDSFSYHVLDATADSFNASAFAGKNNKYFIAVQSVNNDVNVISSQKAFITKVEQGKDVPAAITKSQVNSPIVLENGKLVINWKNGDFYQMLTKNVENYRTLAEDFVDTVFAVPFTFTVEDLVNNRVTFRLRATSISEDNIKGVSKYFDINAKNLLADLVKYGQNNGFDVMKRLELLLSNTLTGSSAQRTLRAFAELLEKGSFGVANTQILFDDIFESLQFGSYELEYCLLGNDSTLNSIWYSFENVNGQNKIFVNNEPYVTFKKVGDASDLSINSYKVIIKKSQVYSYDASELSYKLVDAENYVMKLYDDNKVFEFAIVKGVSEYSMTLLDGEHSQTVSVYRSTADGTIDENGEYLMFFINHNNANSVLGAFGDVVVRGTYRMQIYAVGNNVSLSSKSEFFRWTLYGFGETFSLENGVFSWTPNTNKDTSVIYKKNTNPRENLVLVDGSMATSTYALDGLGEGLYDYVKFVIIGEVTDKIVYVDSEVIVANNVEKLAKPKITSSLGYLKIDDTANKETYKKVYSDTLHYNYSIKNDVMGDLLYGSVSNSKPPVLLYEVGTTGLEAVDEEFRYKESELFAKEFSVAALGSTATLTTTAQEGKYYLKELSCADATAGGANKIGLRSEFESISAAMLDKVAGASLTVSNGVATWAEVSGKAADNLTLSGEGKVIYKVTVSQYRNSNTSNSVSQTDVIESKVFHTAQNMFDFATINKGDFENEIPGTAIKICVQAAYLSVAEITPADTEFVKLVEGGFAYGGLKFDGSEIFALMSDGVTLDGIQRLNEIDENSLQISNGRLTWTYTDTAVGSENAFAEKYAFVVTDENGREIKGRYDVARTLEDGKYQITFTENAGEILPGNQILKVYASQGAKNQEILIKSYPAQISLQKLATVDISNFTISYDITSNAEILDLSNFYLEADPQSVIKLTMTIQRKDGEENPVFEFDKTNCKLFIFNNAEDVDESLAHYIVLGDEDKVNLSFEVTKAGVLHSDISKTIKLQRSSWGSGEIVWNNTDAQFEWDYQGELSFQTTTTATRVHDQNVVTATTANLFVDSGLTEQADVTLANGEVLSIMQEYEACAKIMLGDKIYFIKKTDYALKSVLGETEQIDPSTTYKILAKGEQTTTIQTQNGDKFVVENSAMIEPIFIVEVTYGEDELSQIKRTYTTKDSYFKPTMVGKVRISVRVRLGNTNVQSAVLEHPEEGQFVDFELFQSGRGTAENPYVIANEAQFKNISKRMQKEDCQKTFVENHIQIEDEEPFYFSLAADIDLTSAPISGVLFGGEFDGVIYGNDHTISYVSKGVGKLKTPIPVSVGWVLSPTTETSTTYNYGSAIFERFSKNSSVRDLSIRAAFKDESAAGGFVLIQENSLMAGLVIFNEGTINNVKMIDFENAFYGNPYNKRMMSYSGIASINGASANIISCANQSNMNINGQNSSQVMFVGGISYVNYGSISSCKVGENTDGALSMSVQCTRSLDVVLIAGIVNTNGNDNARIENCTNSYRMTVTASSANNQNVAYIGGIADRAIGTLSSNVDNSTKYADTPVYYHGEIAR